MKWWDAPSKNPWKDPQFDWFEISNSNWDEGTKLVVVGSSWRQFPISNRNSNTTRNLHIKRKWYDAPQLTKIHDNSRNFEWLRSLFPYSHISVQQMTFLGQDSFRILLNYLIETWLLFKNLWNPSKIHQNSQKTSKVLKISIKNPENPSKRSKILHNPSKVPKNPAKS